MQFVLDELVMKPLVNRRNGPLPSQEASNIPIHCSALSHAISAKIKRSCCSYVLDSSILILACRWKLSSAFI